MQLTALSLILLGTLAQAAHGLLQRSILARKVASKSLLLCVQNILAAVLFLVVVLWVLFQKGPLFPMQTLFWVGVIGSTVTSAFIQWANARSRELAEYSLTAPLNGMTPGMVALAAIALGELPSVIGWVGISCIAFGAYWHGLEGAGGEKWIRPFSLLRLPTDFHKLSPQEQLQARNNCLALRLAYGAALAGTLGLLSDALVVRNGPLEVGFLCYSITLAAIFSTGLAQARPLPLSGVVLVGLLGLAWFLHIALGFAAFAYAPIASVGSMKRLAIVFGLVGAYFFLQEQKALTRLGPASFIVGGAMLLALDDPMLRILQKYF